MGAFRIDFEIHVIDVAGGVLRDESVAQIANYFLGRPPTWLAVAATAGILDSQGISRLQNTIGLCVDRISIDAKDALRPILSTVKPDGWKICA